MLIEFNETCNIDDGWVFELKAPVEYRDITVPVGFRSDGASVPRVFWSVIFPPTDRKAIKAAVVHDYLYTYPHPVGWTRAMADKAFLDLLLECGIPKWKAYIACIGVRIFGASHWEACHD